MTGVVYSNFDFVFATRSDGAYDVEIRYPGLDRDVDHRTTCLLPPDVTDLATGDALTRLRNARRDPRAADAELPFTMASMTALRDYGERLFGTIMPKPMETVLALRAGLADHEGEGLRLRIDISKAPELAVVPWEALFRRANDAWLAIDEQTPLVRLLDAADRPAPVPINGTVRLLIVIAVPQKDLDAGREIASIRERIGTDARFAVEVLIAATRGALERALDRVRPHIVHFIGHGGFDDADQHGRRKGHIFLVSEKDSDGYDRVPSDALRDLLDIERPVLVVLNTCQGGTADTVDRYGGTAQNLVRRAIPYVVAMQFPISDEAALAFSEYFYARLLAGYGIDAAVARGRAAIRNRPDEATQVELITPVLYTAVADPGPVIAPAAVVATPIVVPPKVVPPDASAPHRWWLAGGALVLMLLAIGAAVLLVRSELTLSAPGFQTTDNAMATIDAGDIPTDAMTDNAMAMASDGEAAMSASDGGDAHAAGAMPEAPVRGPAAPHPPVMSTQQARALAATRSPLEIIEPPLPEPTPEPAPLPPDVLLPPPPPPPPSPPAAMIEPVTAQLFFDFNSIAPGPNGALVADHVRALIAAAGPGVRVRIIGHTDTMGSRRTNLIVSRMRAHAVAHLLAEGLDPTPPIAIEGVGESAPAIATADGVREPQNRRVEIIVEPAR